MERGQDSAAGAAGILAVAAGWQRVHHPQVAGAAAGGGTTQRYAWCLKNKENPCEVKAFCSKGQKMNNRQKAGTGK